MDIAVAKYFYDSSVEKYDESSGSNIVINVISLFLSFYAAYLSWTCNVNSSMPARIFFAFFAFMFGALYLLLYFIFRSGTCPQKPLDVYS